MDKHLCKKINVTKTITLWSSFITDANFNTLSSNIQVMVPSFVTAVSLPNPADIAFKLFLNFG